MERNQCLKNIATNFGIGATLGGSIGAVYGTFDAFRFKIPGIYKIRHIGQTTITTGAVLCCAAVNDVNTSSAYLVRQRTPTWARQEVARALYTQLAAAAGNSSCAYHWE